MAITKAPELRTKLIISLNLIAICQVVASSQLTPSSQPNLKQYGSRAAAVLVGADDPRRQVENALDSAPSSPLSALSAHSVSLLSVKSQTHQEPLPGPPTCQLPPTWAGRWYQSNKEPIRVTNSDISDKGVCRDQKGDKFLFEFGGNQAKNQQPCLMCLVINERHLNVLQYKESSCQPIPANYHNRSSNLLAAGASDDRDHSLLDSICNDITGDAPLESLFRLDTPPIECPVSGQYSFSYDACREPQSTLDSCIDKKQLNFKFSACPDVPGSESKYEVLKCYADWSEGNNYYMIGRLEHASNQGDKGKFRCFVYERTPDGRSIQMAQSLEESCYGLINANLGPKILRLTVRQPVAQRCSFPSHIQSQSENWLSVDNSLIYIFNQNSSKYQVKETKEGSVIEEATCLQQFAYNPQNQPQQPLLHPHQSHQQNARSHNNNNQVPQAIYRRHSSSAASYTAQTDQSSPSAAQAVTSDMVYLVQITKGCRITNYCVRFYRRSNGIVQIDYFVHTPGDNQCRSVYSSGPQTQIITSTNLEHQRCPFEGVYTIEAPIESDLTYNPSNIFVCPRQSFLTSQCDHPSRLRIHSKCSPAKYLVKNLYCLGSWTTNGLVRLLLADDERQRYSAWYRDYSGLLGGPDQDELLPQAPSSSTPTTRSQLLLSASASAVQNQNLINSIAPIVDLQIALITPQVIPTKPMLVRLTRRNHCSDLKTQYGQGQGWFASQIPSSSASLPSYYASSSTTSFASSSFRSSAQSRLAAASSILIPSLIVKLLVTKFLI